MGFTTTENRAEGEREWNATVVTKENETVAELRAAFDAVCNSINWKAPWAATVPAAVVGRVMRAVEFYHADRPVIIGIEALTGRVIMQGRGYQG